MEDDNEKELPMSQSQNNGKKRKEPVGKHIEAPKNNKKRKLNEYSDEDDSEEEVKSRGKKSAKGSAAKKGKKVKEESESDFDEEPAKKGGKGPKMDDLEKRFAGLLQDGKLKSLTAAELKEFLTVKNMPNKGNKNFMIELIQEYFENNFNL